MKQAITAGIVLLSFVFLASGCANTTPSSEIFDNANSLPTVSRTPSTVQNSGAEDSNNPVFNPATTEAITIQEDSFSPPVVQIGVGDTITWTNAVQTEHSVKADSFSSGNLRQGETFSYQFPSAGTYDYACGLHPDMTGEIIVK